MCLNFRAQTPTNSRIMGAQMRHISQCNTRDLQPRAVHAILPPNVPNLQVRGSRRAAVAAAALRIAAQHAGGLAADRLPGLVARLMRAELLEEALGVAAAAPEELLPLVATLSSPSPAIPAALESAGVSPWACTCDGGLVVACCEVMHHPRHHIRQGITRSLQSGEGCLVSRGDAAQALLVIEVVTYSGAIRSIQMKHTIVSGVWPGMCAKL